MFLALNPKRSVTIKEIANAYEISQNHLMKVVQLLRQLGYLRTVRGHLGGIWLDKPPQQIMIGSVLREVGEDREIAECFVQEGVCRIEAVCKLKHALFDANRAFFAVLEKMSLADIVTPTGNLDLLVKNPEIG